MPELPEVEHARAVIERAAVGRRIVRVECADDPIVIPDGAAAIERALSGCTVVAAHRHGKWLWLELDQRAQRSDGRPTPAAVRRDRDADTQQPSDPRHRAPHLLSHLGMTGSWRTPGDEPLRLESSPKELDRAWPPRFTKLSLELDDARHLAFTNARRLGRVLLRDDPRSEPPLSALGFDPLLELPPLPRFRALLARRRGLLKGLLLDQSFAAGVGNWMADEILYRAGIDPRRTLDTLEGDEVRRVHSALREVVRVAVAADAVSDRYPKSWLFHHRWEKGTRTADGEPIAHTTVAGRTTAWVPSRQR